MKRLLAILLVLAASPAAAETIRLAWHTTTFDVSPFPPELVSPMYYAPRILTPHTKIINSFHVTDTDRWIPFVTPAEQLTPTDVGRTFSVTALTADDYWAPWSNLYFTVRDDWPTQYNPITSPIHISVPTHRIETAGLGVIGGNAIIVGREPLGFFDYVEADHPLLQRIDFTLVEFTDERITWHEEFFADVASIPEPSTVALFVPFLVAMLLHGRRAR